MNIIKEASKRFGEPKTPLQVTNTFNSTPESTATSTYQLHISNKPEDKAWDDFLAVVPGGHHVQMGLWAQVKDVLGWGVIRVVATSDERIVAGAQVLTKHVSGFGRIGLVLKGPIFTSSNPVLEPFLIKELVRHAIRGGLQILIVQPPNNGEAIISHLTGFGFQPAMMNIAPTATILIDLHKDLDAIQEEMNKSTRRNIRAAQRKGITVREGTDADIDPFYNTYKATSQRKKFSPFPEEYYKRFWHLFNMYGYAKLFVAEFEGETVSAQLSIPFGDTVINKMTAWSGEYAYHRPNEALYWAVIQWAKAQGFRYYDLEGINADAARDIAETDKVPDNLKNTFTPFKLGFGGQITYFPGAYVYISDPVMRAAYRVIVPRTYQSQLMKKVMGYLRTS